jgi:hypothetical protein
MAYHIQQLHAVITLAQQTGIAQTLQLSKQESERITHVIYSPEKLFRVQMF